MRQGVHKRSRSAALRRIKGRTADFRKGDRGILHCGVRPVSKYVKFSGLEVLSDFTPPELSARLYIDMDASGEVAARLEYLYGDEKFTPEQSKRKIRSATILQRLPRVVGQELF